MNKPRDDKSNVKSLTAIFEAKNKNTSPEQTEGQKRAHAYVTEAQQAKMVALTEAVKKEQANLKNSFDAYRDGWDDLWERQLNAGAPSVTDIETQQIEVNKLLVLEQREQSQAVEDFAQYLRDGGDPEEMLINVDVQNSFIDYPQDKENFIGTLGVTGANKNLKNMLALQSEFRTIISTMDLQLRKNDPTFAETHKKRPFVDKATIQFGNSPAVSA